MNKTCVYYCEGEDDQKLIDDDGNTEVFYFKNGVATMGNIQKNFGSTAGRKVKAWRGVLCFWHCGTSKMWEKW